MMASDARNGEQDQGDVQDDQIDDVPEDGPSPPPGDEADIALDKTEEDAAREDEADRKR